MAEYPNDLEAERAAVGAMLLDGSRVVPFAMSNMQLPADAFYNAGNRRVYEAVCELFRQGRPVDVLTTADVLGDAALDEVGGRLGLADMVAAVPDSSHAEYYLDIVRQKWLLRRQITFCREIENMCMKPGKTGDEVLAAARERFMAEVGQIVHEKGLGEYCDELLAEWYDVRKRRVAGEYAIAGLPTPWRKLNDLMGGLQPGLTLIAARPSQGKTTLEDNIFLDLAAAGIPVARVTLDMNAKRLVARSLVRKAGVSLPALKGGYAKDKDFGQLTDAAMVLEKYPMWINGNDREVHGICAWARGMKLKHNIQALSVDYVQQVTASVPGVKMFGENQEITYVSRMFKSLANELNIPVVLLSQLNRGADKDDRVPRLSDMRGSGSLEQDANVVILIYHDKDLLDLDGGKVRPQWLHVAKNQDGETGEIPYKFMASYFRFNEVEAAEFERWGR